MLPRRKPEVPPSTREDLNRYSLGTSLILIAPLLILLVGALFYPVSRLIIQSFAGEGFGLAQYGKIFGESLFLKVFLRTFRIALLCTLFALLLGYPVALALARLTGWRKFVLLGCVMLPLWTSALSRSYAWVILLQRRGLVNELLLATGVTDQPLRLLYTETAIVIAMTHVLLPFMILPIYSVLQGIPGDYVKAARSLGAGSVRAFLNVTLPLSLPGLFAGSLLVFIIALGFYVVPAIVGGAGTLMISTLIGQQMTVDLNWSLAGALCTVLLAVTLLLAALFRRFLMFGHTRV